MKKAISDGSIPAGERLNALLAEAGLAPLDSVQTGKFELYLSLLLRWNTRINLTSIRAEEEILCRHFVESIHCARALPLDIRTLLDFGSGAGFPGIPIGICRPEVAVTLAESKGKKAAFLSEAVRVLGIAAKVHAGRAEALHSSFGCVTLRAVDRMEVAVEAAARLVGHYGWLALMTTSKELDALKSAAGAEFSWRIPPESLGGEDRILVMGVKDIQLASLISASF
jgi:16S rRNA (guanine527-N7)-methyltransferase